LDLQEEQAESIVQKISSQDTEEQGTEVSVSEEGTGEVEPLDALSSSCDSAHTDDLPAEDEGFLSLCVESSVSKIPRPVELILLLK
jgi:hypothetical protein